MKDNKMHEIQAKLYDISLKIRSLGYLVECQRDDGVPPLDREELINGLGALISREGRKLFKIWRELDALSVAKKKK